MRQENLATAKQLAYIRKIEDDLESYTFHGVTVNDAKVFIDAHKRPIKGVRSRKPFFLSKWPNKQKGKTS
jgi:hypothetical protein